MLFVTNTETTERNGHSGKSRSHHPALLRHWGRRRRFYIVVSCNACRRLHVTAPVDQLLQKTREYFAHISAQLIAYCKMTFAEDGNAHAPPIPGNARPTRSGES
jgi:hypothetical protein